ncbi:protein-glutamate O-methyltransferase [Rhodocytophaga rosea]|uniref:protein-glutamate O-methyltransferase n=1 Tax=Rhodocytophaga rosea TaxID=2704465 RepID=A0A6C0GJL4_9BACT|nr:protein-glutamate O-methyltransferase [Rhodocytophaga rosea]QHT68149.1 protein-glutamate O-methyltransferase [Rhodocytophaga rosea]
MNIFQAKMSTAEFNKLSTFIYNEYGIKLPPVKKTMLESRLQKRLHALQFSTFREYCDFAFSNQGKHTEIIPMIDLVTTNKTDFFREPVHFDFLQTYILPELIRASPSRPLKVWSAGCSSGEEPYTLAMVLQEYAETHPPLNYSVMATDISTQVLNKAITAVYSEERIAGIPMTLKRKYFLKSKDAVKRTVRIVPHIRSKVQFARLNFMDDVLDVPADFDLVFCRNVIIYFDKPTQEKVINKLCDKIKPGGYFFLGHSESITGMTLPLQQLKPTIFRKI